MPSDKEWKLITFIGNLLIRIFRVFVPQKKSE